MDPPPPVSAAKLRLMCSYGGHIAPRPHSKSLFYSGGDTRIVSIPSTAASSLSSFTSAVSAALSVAGPFTLKYQLPGHDLDSLVSLCSDDDLLVLLDELPRLPPPSRIRLFLFSPKPPQSVLCHPKTETWFIDALNSARMMQKGETCQNEDLPGGCGGGMLAGAESIVLETNSSFGSTSSSASMSNFPSGRPQDDDSCPDNRPKFPVVDLPPSDYRGTSGLLHPQTGFYYEHAAKATTFETRAAPSASLEPDSSSIPFPSFIPFHQTAPASAFPVIPHLLPAGTMYLPQQQQPVCLLSGSPSQPVYHPQPSLYHPANAQCPIYVFPSNSTPAQPYSLGHSIPCGLSGTSDHLRYAIPPMPSFHKAGDASDPPPPTCTITEQHVELHQGQNLVQHVDLDQRETLSPKSEFDDDPDRVQIYKSQPPLPTLPSHYQTMTKATTLLLSEALAQLHTDGC